MLLMAVSNARRGNVVWNFRAMCISLLSERERVKRGRVAVCTARKSHTSLGRVLLFLWKRGNTNLCTRGSARIPKTGLPLARTHQTSTFCRSLHRQYGIFALELFRNTFIRACGAKCSLKLCVSFLLLLARRHPNGFRASVYYVY